MNMLSGLRPPGSQLLRDACRLRGEQLAAASSERGLRGASGLQATARYTDPPDGTRYSTYRSCSYTAAVEVLASTGLNLGLNLVTVYPSAANIAAHLLLPGHQSASDSAAIPCVHACVDAPIPALHLAGLILSTIPVFV